jgi:hypothetical protein
MLHLINVVPFGDGWTVEVDEVANGMAFHSGAKAEAAARDLGRRVARAGEPALVSIYLRDGVLAARFQVQASEAWSDAV